MIYILGLDIGGTHISGGLTEVSSGKIRGDNLVSCPINAAGDKDSIIAGWADGIRHILGDIPIGNLAGIGISMPGPFDYEKGISFIKGLGKYDSLYGVHVKHELINTLNLPEDFPVHFQNDAVCFALGEYAYGAAAGYHKVLAMTLGTGMGTAFLQDGKPVQQRENVPPGGTLYQVPYGKGIAEDRFSTRGLLQEYEIWSGRKAVNAERLSEYASRHDREALKVFSSFGKDFAIFLQPWLRSFGAECLVLGGNISRSFPFFREAMQVELSKEQVKVEIILSALKEKAAILGAVSLLNNEDNRVRQQNSCRKTKQFVLPLKKETPEEGYDIYPAFQLDENKIHLGLDTLIEYIIAQKQVVIDGYLGVFWDKLKADIQDALPKNLKISVQDISPWFLPEGDLESMIKPYLGEDGAVWGKKCDKELSDFFDQRKIASCVPDKSMDINILIGTGSALASWDAPVIYVDMPKNELQYRMRAGSITNLGGGKRENAVEMYKRSYFVDWAVLNRHKKNILKRIEIVADGQRPESVTWMYFNDLENALRTMSKNVFRARPWFEPGVWGGQWIKRKIKGVNEDEINYAWSFELITPENGLLLESDGLLLEVSFDFLMFLYNKEVLGEKYAERFGDEFPIRFDFLDTVEGGNLSVQCHPSAEYIRRYFGENFTQDETYYILDAVEGSGVYLGFQDNIDPVKFRKDLEKSHKKNVPVNITQYVQYHSSKKHDLFLIPNSTVHSAGAGNLVLEISATPYIYTFKMYDWVRPGLNGAPRPINIEHAFNNLNFDRKGEKVKEELISHPYLLNEGEGWKCDHLPTHAAHFYDIHRYEFEGSVTINTNGSCHVLMLVEGSLILVVTKNGFRQRFHFGETFAIPAAAENYLLINEGAGKAKVVKAFLKV